METENSTSESGIFNTNNLHKINRKGKPCCFRNKLSSNMMKCIFDFFYYRELYELGKINLYFYQCFTDYQLLTWKIEMNNIIDIFHLEIKNPDEEIDDTLTKCIGKNRTYNMKDHPGCFVRINKEGINIISCAFYDNSVQKDMNYFIKNKTADAKKGKLNWDFINNKLNNININSTNMNEFESPNKFNNIENFSLSETPSNLGSADSITANKISDSYIWNTKYIQGSYLPNMPCINLLKTCTLKFGFSFYHIIKGDYQLYLNHSLINMKNAKLILQVFINNYNIYTLKEFPSDNLIDQYESEEEEKEKNIKLREYLICSITKKMFEESSNNGINDDKSNKKNDYEIKVVFQNTNLFWKAGWLIDGGRLLRKVYEVNESNKNNFKRFKSDNIDFSVIKKIEDNNNIKLRSRKRNSFANIPNSYS